MSEQIVGFVNPDGSGEGNWSRVCEQHPEPNPLCHVQQAAPRRLTRGAEDLSFGQPAFMQAQPVEDDATTWQAIRDVFVAAIATTVVLWFAFSVWLTR